jgi:hypothetical protein
MTSDTTAAKFKTFTELTPGALADSLSRPFNYAVFAVIHDGIVFAVTSTLESARIQAEDLAIPMNSVKLAINQAGTILSQ